MSFVRSPWIHCTAPGPDTASTPTSAGPITAPVWSAVKRTGVTSCGSRRSEEHTSELQSRLHLVCRLLLEKKKKKTQHQHRVSSMLCLMIHILKMSWRNQKYEVVV